jgi:hypothetical protein
MARSIKAGIYNKLLSLAVTPYIYHRELPQNPSYPATVYDVISDINLCHTHDHVTGPRQARVQIDVYAETVAAAEAAMEAYFTELAGFSGSIGDGLSPSQFTDVAIFDEGANPDLDFEQEPILRQIEGRSRDFMIVY